MPLLASHVAVQAEDFDLGVEVAHLREAGRGIGAIASFVGTVREASDGCEVRTMELEHYPGMTERAIGAMVQEAARRFEIQAVRVIHRVGVLRPGDQIVLVAAAAAHRQAAFDACEFLMDCLKTQAPFWKKEHTPQGARWVDARVADDQALARWGVAAAGNAATDA